MSRTEPLRTEFSNVATRQTLIWSGNLLRETLRRITVYGQVTRYGHSRGLLAPDPPERSATDLEICQTTLRWSQGRMATSTCWVRDEPDCLRLADWASTCGCNAYASLPDHKNKPNHFSSVAQPLLGRPRCCAIDRR